MPPNEKDIEKTNGVILTKRCFLLSPRSTVDAEGASTLSAAAGQPWTNHSIEDLERKENQEAKGEKE